MPHQLTADCLNEIFEYLANDKATLHSCLLVNHLWCEISVRILWRSIRNYDTLISCLPNESKEILYKNKITTSTAISKPPLFNYIKFIKNLSIYDVDSIIKNILKNYQSITPQSLDYIKHTITQEVYKLLMAQIYSLRGLDFYSYISSYTTTINIPNVNFISYPGAKDCLKNLTELRCSSDIYPEFYYQLSKTCHNIQKLNITFRKIITNGLTDLISVQQNLKYLKITQKYCGHENTTTIISFLKKIPNTLIKLAIYECLILLPFISKFKDLQELVLSFCDNTFLDDYKGFSKLQHITFSQLQILKFDYKLPRIEFLIKFLEINGGGLEEFSFDHPLFSFDSLNSLNLSIAKFCPNLKILSTLILKSKTLEEIFNNCQYLESIKVWYGDSNCLNAKELLEVVTKYSPKKLYELKLNYMIIIRSVQESKLPKLLPEELESIFINWMNRIPLKPLSCIFNCSRFDESTIMGVIEKYKKLGVIKKFEFNV